MPSLSSVRARFIDSVLLLSHRAAARLAGKPQFSPLLTDATDLDEAIKPDIKRSRCPRPGRSICSKSLECERSGRPDRLDGARAGQEANDGAKSLKRAASFGRNASMALEPGGSVARSIGDGTIRSGAVQHYAEHAAAGGAFDALVAVDARAGPAPSSGRGLDEVDEAGLSSMRTGRVDAEGPSVPGGPDILR